MCIFSKEVESVSNTQIFARISGDHQFLVYSMNYMANQELAMILPLPTPAFSEDNAVRFIDLSGYPDFFKDLNIGFGAGAPQTRSVSVRNKSLLAVKDVGSFEASFVPSIADFNRLDPRFRISENEWDKLPQYSDYGFAVFKLKSGSFSVHPMALAFPGRDTTTLFFPTVHIHDGKVEPKAQFDHALYCQSLFHCQSHSSTKDWEVSAFYGDKDEYLPASKFVEIDKTQGIVESGIPIQRCKIIGLKPNKDTLIEVSEK